MANHPLTRFIVEVDGRPYGECFASSSMDVVIDLLPQLPPACRVSVESEEAWLKRSTPAQRAALAEAYERTRAAELDQGGVA